MEEKLDKLWSYLLAPLVLQVRGLSEKTVFDEAISFFNETPEFKNKDDVLSFIANFLDKATYLSKESMNEKFKEDATMIINDYEIFLSNIFDGQSYEGLKNAYSLGVDEKIKQLTTIKNNMESFFSQAFMYSDKIEILGNYLSTNFKVIEQRYNSDGEDLVKYFLKGAGIGAFAFINPFAAAASAVAAYSGYKKDNADKDVDFNNYIDNFDKLYEYLRELKRSYISAYTEYLSYVSEKGRSILVLAVDEIIRDLEKRGYSVDHFVSFIDECIKEKELEYWKQRKANKKWYQWK